MVCLTQKLFSSHFPTAIDCGFSHTHMHLQPHVVISLGAHVSMIILHITASQHTIDCPLERVSACTNTSLVVHLQSALGAWTEPRGVVKQMGVVSGCGNKDTDTR